MHEMRKAKAKKAEALHGSLHGAGECRWQSRLNKTGAWLTIAPNESMGFYLNKHEFHDGVAVRYNANLNNVPPRCEATACGASYTLSHALTCAHGGNRILRHDMVVRAVHSLARTALGTGPTRVELEPWLIKRGAVGPDGRVCRDGLRPDLLLTGLDPYRPRSYLDVRIPYPDASAYAGTSVARLLEMHEAEKVTQYKAACENHQQQSGEFVPFVATTDGVLVGGRRKCSASWSSGCAPSGSTSPRARSWHGSARASASLSCGRRARASVASAASPTPPARWRRRCVRGPMP